MSVSTSEQATTSPQTLPQISTLPSLPTESRAQILDLLFEPCDQLHTLSLETLGSQTFDSYTSLISAVGTQLRDLQKSQLWSDGNWLAKILNAHPRLGEKKVGALSEASRKEQEAMKKAGGEGGESEEVAERLRGLNEEYEKKFDGMKYVVFVNGRSRPVIMEDMERRIKRGDLDLEKQEAIQAMCDIAVDRAKKMGGS